jgi:hypothetical protein
VTITFTIEDDGASPVEVRQEVTRAFVHGQWEVRGGGWLGYGATVDAAVVSWLAHRLGTVP